MKNFKRVILFFLGVCVIVVLIVVGGKGDIEFAYEFSNKSLKAFVKKSRSSEGGEENPGGRSAYERLRHASPFTGRIPDNIGVKEVAFLRALSRRQMQQRSANVEAASQWSFAGPSAIGGRTRALAFDKSDASESTILAGGVTGGMWRSDDGAEHWVKTTASDQLHSVSCLAQDIRGGHQQVWYYGTGEMFGPNDLETGLFKGNGIFKSVDGGRSWRILPSTQTDKPHVYDSPFDYTWNIVIDHLNLLEDELYVAASGGIYRSTDGGSSWKRVLGTGNASGRYTDIAITPTGILYATLSNVDGADEVDAGIYRSTDGIVWENITPDWWPSVFNRVVVGICASNENKLYVLADLSTSFSKSHRLASLEMGKGWTNLSANLPDYDYNTGDYDSQLSFCMYIKVRPDNENVVFLGGINLYRSTDGFTTKNNIAWIGGYDARKTDLSKYPDHHPDQHALVFFKDVEKMLSAHDGGISMTDNNMAEYVDWKSLNAGYHTTQFYSIAMNHARTDETVIGGMQDNGTYGTDNINTLGKWESLLAGDGSFCAVSNNGKHVYVSSQYGRIYRQDFDASGKYVGFARVDPRASLGYLFNNPFVLDPYNTNIMYLAGGTDIWRNDNLAGIPSGSNETTLAGWSKIRDTSIDGVISALGISTIPGNILYYGTSQGRLYKVAHANTQNALSTEITADIFPKYLELPTGYISSICIDPLDAQKILVTFSNYEVISMFSSADGGATWTSVSGNLEQNADGSGNGPAVYWVALLHLDDGVKYFAGTSIGLFVTDSLNGDQTVWASVPEIGTMPVYMILARQRDGRVLAATHGNGIYQHRFSNVLEFDFERLFSSLEQNYPNPFTDASGTTIPFSIDEDYYVRLRLLDAQGREVAKLLDTSMRAGQYKLDWNQTDVQGKLPSGLYYYQLTAGGNTFTKRMVLQ